MNRQILIIVGVSVVTIIAIIIGLSNVKPSLQQMAQQTETMAETNTIDAETRRLMEANSLQIIIACYNNISLDGCKTYMQDVSIWCDLYGLKACEDKRFTGYFIMTGQEPTKVPN